MGLLGVVDNEDRVRWGGGGGGFLGAAEGLKS